MIPLYFNPYRDTDLNNLGNKLLLNRFRRNYKDKSLLSSTPQVIDWECRSIDSGRIIYNEGTAKIDGLFIKGDADSLIVFFQGARTGVSAKPYPDYSRWSYYRYTDASVLALADPMYYKYPDVRCGWFLGNDQEDYRYYVANLIKIISHLISVDVSNIILFGSSAGGTAAIGVSRYLNGCFVVGINSQIDYKQFLDAHLRDIYKYANIDLKKDEDVFLRTDNISPLYKSSNKYLLMFNVLSTDDYKDQLLYLCNKLNLKTRYGFSTCNSHSNLFTWLYDIDTGIQRKNHAAVEDSLVFMWIQYFVSCIQSGNLEYLELCSLIVNEYWRTIYTDANLIETARFTIKNKGSSDNTIELIASSDLDVVVSEADWKPNKDGKTVLFQSNKSYIHFIIKIIGSGQLFISFGTKPQTKHVIFTSIIVDDYEVIDKPKKGDFSNPYIFKKMVEDQDIIDIKVKWKEEI